MMVGVNIIITGCITPAFDIVRETAIRRNLGGRFGPLQEVLDTSRDNGGGKSGHWSDDGHDWIKQGITYGDGIHS